MNKSFSLPKPKQKGAILLLSILLSALILTVGMGLIKILATELEFSSDLLFAEKAYFAAESGVELTLQELKESPTQHVDSLSQLIKSDSSEEEAVVHISIQNLIHPSEEFETSVPPKKTIKFRFQKDADLSTPWMPEGTDNFDIALEGAAFFHWKLVCSHSGGTVSLQEKLPAGEYPDFAAQTGIYDNPEGISSQKALSDFLAMLSGDEKNTCFLSFTNLDQANDMTLTLKNTEMAPPTATIRSLGQSNNRSKLILFEYAQKNLSPFFDFGLFHTESGF